MDNLNRLNINERIYVTFSVQGASSRSGRVWQDLGSYVDVLLPGRQDPVRMSKDKVGRDRRSLDT